MSKEEYLEIFRLLETQLLKDGYRQAAKTVNNLIIYIQENYKKEQ